MSAAYSRPSTAFRERDAVVLVGICLGFFVILLDATAVNVALGAISSSLGGSIAALQWVVNAYTVVFAGLMIAAGSVADRRGALWTFRAGLTAFAAASACARWRRRSACSSARAPCRASAPPRSCPRRWR